MKDNSFFLYTHLISTIVWKFKAQKHQRYIAEARWWHLTTSWYAGAVARCHLVLAQSKSLTANNTTPTNFTHAHTDIFTYTPTSPPAEQMKKTLKALSYPLETTTEKRHLPTIYVITPTYKRLEQVSQSVFNYSQVPSLSHIWLQNSSYLLKMLLLISIHSHSLIPMTPQPHIPHR